MWFLILNSTACSISNKISVSGLSGFRSNKLHLHILLGVNFEINLSLASKIQYFHQSCSLMKVAAQEPYAVLYWEAVAINLL